MKYWFVALFLLMTFSAVAQVKYSLKVEGGYLDVEGHTLEVDPGPDWRGYYVENVRAGFDINAINGISLFKQRLSVGLGLGYVNLEGYQGYSIFSDIEYVPMKTRFSPLLNLKIGQNHLWNQYDGGTKTTLGELTIGVNARIKKNLGVYAKIGGLGMQQTFFAVTRVGVRF